MEEGGCGGQAQGERGVGGYRVSQAGGGELSLLDRVILSVGEGIILG